MNEIDVVTKEDFGWIIEHLQEVELREGYEYYFSNRYGNKPDYERYGYPLLYDAISLREELIKDIGDTYDGFYHVPKACYCYDDERGYKPISQHPQLWNHFDMGVITYDEYREYVELWK